MLLRRWVAVQRRVIPQAGWTRRRLSTNPMAPDAPLIAPANSAAVGAAGNARKISYEEESFVSKHFGKISSVVLGIAGGLIYTYYLSIQDRKKVEEIIETSAAVDPYEILQCRYMNQLSKEEYISVLQALASHISTKQPIAYREFINLATQGLAKAQHTAPIQSGFLLDRMVQALVQRIVVDKKPLVLEVEPSLGPTSSTPVSPSVPVSYADEPLPADLLCVIFQLTMLREPADRCEAFFALGQMLEGNDISGHNASSDTLDGNTESTSSTSYDKQLKLETVRRIVELLQATDQIPLEKQVKETGTVWPVRTYCRKSPMDLMKDKVPESAIPETIKGKARDTARTQVDLTTAHWTKEDLATLLMSRQVCAWGSCYKDREDD